MARKKTETLLNTKTARLRLNVQANPHFTLIQEGMALGYRRLEGKAGTWIARRYDRSAANQMLFQKLGSADDFTEADGVNTLSHTQALTKAREWFAELAKNDGVVVAPITVAEVMEAYMASYKAKGRKSPDKTEKTIAAHILPKFGKVEAEKLTTGSIRTWLDGLATAPAKLRTGKHATTPNTRPTTNKAARRATANRIMTIFRAALNLAYENGKITSDNAWKRVKQLPNADVAKIQYLDDAESKALAEACPTDLKPIVTAALLTGADYSELYKAKVSAFEARDQRLTVAQKREKRTIALGDEAMAFFVGATKDRGKDEIMFSRSNGKPWGSTHHSRPFALAVAKAGITRPASEPKITFHILRHSYAVRMLRRGMPMHQVSKQLGHKSILITQKHYAHVLEDDVMISVKAMAGELGIVSQCATDPR